MEDLPIEATMFIAGAMGALSFAFVKPDRTSTWRSAGNLAVGTMVSFWLTPWICLYLGIDWTEKHKLHGSAFVVGLLGFMACRGVVGAFESEVAAGLFPALVRVWKRAWGMPVESASERRKKKKSEDDEQNSFPRPEDSDV